MYSQQAILSNGPPPIVHSHSLAIVHARSSGGRMSGAFLGHFQFSRHRYLDPLTAKFLQAILNYFIFIFISHELLTNVPSNHIYPSSTLNKEYFYINMVT